VEPLSENKISASGFFIEGWGKKSIPGRSLDHRGQFVEMSSEGGSIG